MLRSIVAVACATVLPLCFARAARAESCDLTLERVLAIARERAPAIVAAETRVDEARARLAGASLLLRDNPELDGDVGPRIAPDGGQSTDIRARLSQALELGGARAARIDGAQAGVALAVASADEQRLQVQRAAASAFLRARAGAEQAQLAEEAAGMADDLLRVAERRHRAGDVAVLDVNVARAAAARARADAAAARAAAREAAGALAVLLGLDDVPEPCGALADAPPLELADLLRRAPERADLRALAASIDEAEAEQRLGAAQMWPGVRVGAEYKREEGDEIYMGGLSISVPLFERGQAARAAAEARARRLRGEHEAATRAASLEVRTAWDVYRTLRAAADQLTNELPTLAESETLAARSYDAGELSLAELLLLRRETLDVRRAAIEHALAAAVAGVELQAAAGVLR